MKIVHHGSYTQSNIDMFNADMQTLNNSGAIGQSMVSWANSNDTTLDVYWTDDGNAAGGNTDPNGQPNPNHGAIQLNSQSDDYTGPGNNNQEYPSEASGSSVVTLGHELGHGAIGHDDPSVVPLVENPIRAALGLDARETYGGEEIPNPPQDQIDLLDDFLEQWEN